MLLNAKQMVAGLILSASYGTRRDVQGNQSMTRCDNDEDDDDTDDGEEEEDSAVEMGPSPDPSVLRGNPDADYCVRRGGSVESIDTLSSTVDRTDPHQTTNGDDGGKDQR